MTKKRSFLWLYLVLSFVIIVVAGVLSLTLGLNLGTELGGGSLIQIKFEQSQKAGEQLDAARKAVAAEGYYVERAFVEDKGIESYIVVRTTAKDVKAAELKAALAKKLGISEESVLDPVAINGTVTKNAVLWAAVALVCLLLGVFALGWIRYKLIGGLSLVFTALHALLMIVSLLIITRISINFTTLIMALIGVAVVMFAEVLTLERVREESRYKHNEGAEPGELVRSSVRATLRPLIVLGCLVLLIALVMVCVPLAHIAMTGASLVVCLVCAGVSYYFVGMPTYTSLFELKRMREKAKLSRNPQVSADKTTKKSTAKKADKKPSREKAKKDKEFEKKMQNKAKSNDQPKPVV